MMAFFIPFALVLLCLVKKLTVMGIIGNTQGVSSAAKPEKKAIIKMLNKLLLDEFAPFLVTVVFTSFFELAVFELILNAKSSSI